jgi:hypothetical protein
MTAARTTRSIALLLVTTVLAVLLAGLTTVATAGPASASCAAPAESGDWRNIDASTRSMSRVVVGLVCGDQVLCDTNGNCTGGDTYVTLRPYGACTPTACDWGIRRATRMADGWLRSTHSFGFKTSNVWVKTYNYSGRTYLRVWVHNDFTAADGRADYTTDEWMLR